MTEVYVTIKALFANEDMAKQTTRKIKASLKKNDQDLTKALHSLYPINNYEDYDQLDVEEIARKKSVLTIFLYTGRTGPVTWFAGSLYKLGAHKIYIRENGDEGGCNHYFLNGEKVSKKKYDGEKPTKPLNEKEIEINKHLFLPEGRIHVKATLMNSWSIGDIYESEILEFKTDDGDRFFHKATGQLKRMAYEGSPKTCEFSAIFERGKHEGEYVSFAKRPTKVKIGKL